VQFLALCNDGIPECWNDEKSYSHYSNIPIFQEKQYKKNIVNKLSSDGGELLRNDGIIKKLIKIPKFHHSIFPVELNEIHIVYACNHSKLTPKMRKQWQTKPF
jgi:hypothetical protein